MHEGEGEGQTGDTPPPPPLLGPACRSDPAPPSAILGEVKVGVSSEG